MKREEGVVPYIGVFRARARAMEKVLAPSLSKEGKRHINSPQNNFFLMWESDLNSIGVIINTAGGY